MIATKWILASCIAMAATGFAKDPVFTSVYTDASECKVFDPCEENEANCGGDGHAECQGPKGYILYEWYSAISTMREVRIRDVESWQLQLSPTSGLQMQSYGQKTEWRLADGILFAVIQRTRECDPEAPKKCVEYLLVRGLRGYESIRSDVDARKANANAEARSIVDKGYLQLHKPPSGTIIPPNQKDK